MVASMTAIHSPDHLKTLLEIYIAGTGISKRRLGIMICDNHMVVGRVIAGHGSSHRSAEAMSIWLSLNWPADLPWPAGVPRLRPRKGMRLRPLRRRPQRNPARLKTTAAEISGHAE
jgi:hypothetical protein